MNLADIRTALSAKLQGCGFNPYKELPSSPDLPAAVVGNPTAINYTQTMSNRVEIVLPVRLLVSAADELDAYARLDEALSTDTTLSVYNALRAADVGAPWRQLACSTANNFGYLQLDGAVALVADLNLTILST